MSSEDLLTVGSGRLSSCSLDSVIGYLDRLLGRKEAEDVSSALAIQTPSDCGGKTAALPVQIEDDDESIQRVMDLSFASVYEMPSSCLPSGPHPVRSMCQKVMTVLTESIDPPESLDSGVESNKSDDESSFNSNPSLLGDHRSLLRHDYQNLLSSTTMATNENNHKQSQSVSCQRRSARRYGSNGRVSNSLESTTTTSPIKGSSGGRYSRLTDSKNNNNNNNKEADKFYEICLGHLCHQMEAGNGAAGTGLGFDRWISIFSLQKHQEELIQLSTSPSGSPSLSSSAANHYHQHHQAHNQQGAKRLPPQRHPSSGGNTTGSAPVTTSSRQNSQEDSVINNTSGGRNNNGKKNHISFLFFIYIIYFGRPGQSGRPERRRDYSFLIQPTVMKQKCTNIISCCGKKEEKSMVYSAQIVASAFWIGWKKCPVECIQLAKGSNKKTTPPGCQRWSQSATLEASKLDDYGDYFVLFTLDRFVCPAHLL